MCSSDLCPQRESERIGGLGEREWESERKNERQSMRGIDICMYVCLYVLSSSLLKPWQPLKHRLEVRAASPSGPGISSIVFVVDCGSVYHCFGFHVPSESIAGDQFRAFGF